MQSRGRLDRNEPSNGHAESYTYDPADPTPVVGGTLMRRSGGRRDQARTERRRAMRVAHQTIHHDPEHPSAVFLPVRPIPGS